MYFMSRNILGSLGKEFTLPWDVFQLNAVLSFDLALLSGTGVRLFLFSLR